LFHLYIYFISNNNNNNFLLFKNKIKLSSINTALNSTRLSINQVNSRPNQAPSNTAQVSSNNVELTTAEKYKLIKELIKSCDFDDYEQFLPLHFRREFQTRTVEELATSIRKQDKNQALAMVAGPITHVAMDIINDFLKWGVEKYREEVNCHVFTRARTPMVGNRRRRTRGMNDLRQDVHDIIEIHSSQNSVELDIVDFVELIFPKLVERYPASFEDEEEILVKFSIDAREFEKHTTTEATLSFIVGGTNFQSSKEVFPVMLFEGKDSSENFTKYCQRVAEGLKKLIFLGIALFIGEKKKIFKFNVIFVADMKAHWAWYGLNGPKRKIFCHRCLLDRVKKITIHYCYLKEV
jgi:hypothetical protein